MNPDKPDRSRGRFHASQERALARSLRRGEPLLCVECETPLDVKPVPQRTDVSYVRHRVVVACLHCHKTAVLDRREAR